MNSSVSISHSPLILALIKRYRRFFIVAFELALIGLSNYLAFWLRFDGVIPDRAVVEHRQMLPWLLVIRGLMFIPFKLYAGLWRYTGLWELRKVVSAVTCSSFLFYLFVRSPWGITSYPRSIFILDSVLLICLLTALRLSQRVYSEMRAGGNKNRKRVLIFGAGDVGEMIVRDMRHSIYSPVGFIDDNRRKVGQHIHGVPVLGTRDDLRKVMRAHEPQEVLIAVSSVEGAIVRELMESLEPFKVPLRTLTKSKDPLDGTLTVKQIRGLSIEDLLARKPVDLKPDRVRELIRGKRVLVTGAGGSIGSELSRQISMLEPGVPGFVRAVREQSLCDRQRSHRPRSWTFRTTVIGDVTDAARLESVFAQYAPEIVFHAAAHKHVPLMELNAGEAVKNNVIGTRTVAEAAAKHRAERFVMISTDKAVNPTSVMGATKRVAELMVQALAPTGGTSFVTVRFGNVLGCNGSVVPRFCSRLPRRAGHRDASRDAPVLHADPGGGAARASRGGRSAVRRYLRAGDGRADQGRRSWPRHLIRLSGLVPDEEIAITLSSACDPARSCSKSWSDSTK